MCWYHATYRRFNIFVYFSVVVVSDGSDGRTMARFPSVWVPCSAVGRRDAVDRRSEGRKGGIGITSIFTLEVARAPGKNSALTCGGSSRFHGALFPFLFHVFGRSNLSCIPAKSARYWDEVRAVCVLRLYVPPAPCSLSLSLSLWFRMTRGMVVREKNWQTPRQKESVR